MSAEKKELKEGIRENSHASSAGNRDTRKWTATTAAAAEAGHTPQDLQAEGEEDRHPAPTQEIEETKRKVTGEAGPLREGEEAQRREEVPAEVAADQEVPQEASQLLPSEQRKRERKGRA